MQLRDPSSPLGVLLLAAVSWYLLSLVFGPVDALNMVFVAILVWFMVRMMNRRRDRGDGEGGDSTGPEAKS